MREKKSNDIKKFLSITNQFPDVFIIDRKNMKLLCKSCNLKLKLFSISGAKKHLSSNLHVLKRNIYKCKPSTLNIKESFINLANGFGGSGIPLNNLRKPIFRKALKVMNKNIPSVNTVRKQFLEKWDKNINNIKKRFFNKHVYVICDETQKKTNRIYCSNS